VSHTAYDCPLSVVIQTMMLSRIRWCAWNTKQ